MTKQGRRRTDRGEHEEAHELNLLPSDEVDEGEGAPVAGNETADGDDDVAEAGVVQLLPSLERGRRASRSETTIADRSKDDGRVESEAVEGDVEGEPGPGATEEDLSVDPL